MDDQTSNPQTTPNNNQKQSLSPWEEDLDVPEETPKPQIIGSFGGSAANAPSQPAKAPVESFNIPSNPGLAQTSAVPVSAPLSPQPQPAEPIQPGVESIVASVPEPAKPAFDDNADIASANAENNTAEDSDLKFGYDSQSPILPTASEEALPEAGLDTSDNAVSKPKIMDIRPAAVPEDETEMQKNTAPALSRLNDIVAPVQEETQAPVAAEKPLAAIPIVDNIIPKKEENKPEVAKQPSNKRNFKSIFSGKKIILILLVLIILILTAGVFLTEKGMLSMGFEKVYGKVGLQNLWGGLSLNSEQALAKSFLTMSENEGYDINGTMTLRVDRNTSSSKLKPLLPADEEKSVSLIPIRAVLASYQSEDSSYTDYYVESDDDTSTSEAQSPSETSTSSAASTDVQSESTDYSANYTDDESSSDAVQDQQVSGSNSSLVNVVTELSGIVGKNGSDITVKVDQPTGKGDIHLVNTDDDLFVFASKVVFENSKVGEWRKYKIDALNSKNLYTEFFSMDPANGLSISGSRTGNEKLGSERVYRYKIDKMEIGDSLSSIGIKSDMVQNISGEAWIGIADKITKKIDLKITTASSYPVSTILVTLNFSSTDDTKVQIPDVDESESLQSISTTDEPTSSAQEDETSEPVMTPVIVPTSDEKRKSDLASIKTALERYHAKYGSYPVAANTTKLDTAGNIVEKAIVPTYLTAIARDPKAAEGWYYGYKSNGKTFMLSARLENTADAQGKQVGDLYLYFVYNE